MSLVPSRPASGEELMPMVTARLGSSTRIAGSARGSSGSASVSPIMTSGMPDDDRDLAWSRLLRSRPARGRERCRAR